MLPQLVIAVTIAAQSPDAGPAAAAPPPTTTTAAEPVPFSLASYGAQQAVLVTTEGWPSVIGQLRKYETVGGKWMQVGGVVEVVVGESGLGWGLGLHPLGVGEPRKTEGDGRGVAGVFALSSAFGRGAPAFKSAMPWLATTPTLACVDDPKSGRYNRIVEINDGTVDFKTAEAMLREDGMYDVGVIVDHNALGDGDRAPIAGRGSCVFLHVWRRKGRGTAGCTAMARWDLEKLVEWLDPAKQPVLVQLPKGEWVKRRLPWGLP